MATYLNHLLPLPLKDSYTIKPKSGVIKSQMESGFAKHRRITTASPTLITLKWSFSYSEFATFQGWVLYDAKNGAEWFDITLLAGLGIVIHKARFTDSDGVYTASLNTSTNKWDVSANVEVQYQPMLSLGGYELTKKYTLADILNSQEIMTNSVNRFLSKI
tara:strand:- start:37 stop:519 length:483 start_codon:yes stop_codon:yes gene_type:complete